MKKFLIIPVLMIVIIIGFYFTRINKISTSNQLVPTPTHANREELTADQIIQALSQKNNWDASRVELKIIANDGDFAKGDVKFKDEMSGGLWFAARVNGDWKIVYDGNGIVTCDHLANYQNFPKDLIPTCYDKQAEKLLTR